MSISGVLLTCEPERLAEVSEAVKGWARSENREVRGGTLIVVTDTESMRADRRNEE